MIIRAEKSNSTITRVTYIFNRWLKMLGHYGKLDPGSLNNDFSTISKLIRDKGIKKTVKTAVRNCRDLVLSPYATVDRVNKSLANALTILCKAQQDPDIAKVRSFYNDQGMREKYRPLSKRLVRENVTALGQPLKYMDVETMEGKSAKLIRRIVEKRAAQAVHKTRHTHSKESGDFRQKVRRATSYCLYSVPCSPSKSVKREESSHYKIDEYESYGPILKKKHGYNTLQEAMLACWRWGQNNPHDPLPMQAYRCASCGKWHIGHARYSTLHQSSEIV
jgi:hypothetical protein